MNSEERKRLAALSFAEKIRLLEKLRDRSLAFAAARQKLPQKGVKIRFDWSGCGLVEADPSRSDGRPVLKGTHIPAEDLVVNFEDGVSIEEISLHFGIQANTVRELLAYAEKHHALIRSLR